MNDRRVLKIGVYSDGRVALDGEFLAVDDLAAVLRRQSPDESVVWYWRESAAEAANPVAETVIRLIVEARLPVRLSANADFSDSAVEGVAQARANVQARVEQVFASARQQAQTKAVVVRPDGRMLLLPVAQNAPAQIVESAKTLFPSEAQKNLAVICDVSWGMAQPPDMAAASQAIPFLGILMGLSFIGKVVWMFDGSALLFESGCKDADVLIVDSARVAGLAAGWEAKARKSMRGAVILVHDRETYSLKLV